MPVVTGGWGAGSAGREGGQVGCTGGVDYRKGRLQLAFCCSAREESEGFRWLDKQREKVCRQPIWQDNRIYLVDEHGVSYEVKGGDAVSSCGRQYRVVGGMEG